MLHVQAVACLAAMAAWVYSGDSAWMKVWWAQAYSSSRHKSWPHVQMEKVIGQVASCSSIVQSAIELVNSDLRHSR